jgi:hypothetical protein
VPDAIIGSLVAIITIIISIFLFDVFLITYLRNGKKFKL